jgi:hypothetical protein
LPAHQSTIRAGPRSPRDPDPIPATTPPDLTRGTPGWSLNRSAPHSVGLDQSSGADSRTKDGKELDPMPIVARPQMLSALLVLIVFPASAKADEPKPSPVPIAVKNTVKLDLQISGVSSGWKVEIKPAHPGSRFEPVVRQVDSGDGGPVQLGEISLDARSVSADRDCAMTIVLTDPEGDAQTFKRSLRLLPQPDDQTVPQLSKTFYLRTSTVAKKDRPGPRPN